jgi:hypothetical protein
MTVRVNRIYLMNLAFLPSFVAKSGNGRRNPLQVILTARNLISPSPASPPSPLTGPVPYDVPMSNWTR